MMPGAINSTAGRRQAHHSDSKVYSSESRQTTNRGHSAKSTTYKHPTTTKTPAAPTDNKPDSRRSAGGACQTNVSRNTKHSQHPISTATHGAGPPVDKMSLVERTSDSDAALGGQPLSTIHHIDSFQNQHTLHFEGIISPSASPTLNHPPPPRPLHSGQDFVAFGWNAHRTRAILNEVCQLFLRDACWRGEGCNRIHPREKPPSGDWLINVKLAERPRALANEASNQGERRPRVEQSRNRSNLGPVVVELPWSPTFPRVNLPREDNSSTQLTKKSQNFQPGKRHSAASKVFVLNNRSNEDASLDRLLVNKNSIDLTAHAHSEKTHGLDSVYCDEEKYSGLYWDPESGFWGYQIDPNAWSDNGQSSNNSMSDSSAFSSRRSTSSQSSITEEPPSPGSTPSSKYPPPPQPETCRHWLRGHCSLGYACQYVHDDLNYDPPVKGTHPPPKHPQTCVKWLRDRCQLGYACNFVHGDLEYSAPTPRRAPTNFTQTRPIENRLWRPKPSTIPPTSQWSMTVDNHAKVTLEAGFKVKGIVTGFETPWVFIGNVPTYVASEEIARLLNPFGPVLDIKLPSFSNSPSMNIKARLSTSTLAAQASAALNGTQAFGGTITARLPISNSNTNVLFQDTSVRIQWEAPSKVGYAGYSSTEHANRAIAAARIPFRDNYVKATIHAGLPVVGVVTVKFRGIPIDANEGDMERFAHPDDVVWERPNYSSLPRALSGIRRILEDQTDLVSFDVMPPPYRGATVSAWAHFSTPSNAQDACNRLHGRKPMFTGTTKIFARHVRSLGYSVSPAMYIKVGTDIETFRTSLWRQNGTTTISILCRPAPQTTLVKLSSEDLKELGRLKSEFEKILNGEVLREAGKAAWDEFFAQPEGTAFLEAVEHQNSGVTIQKDIARRIIKLLGSSRNREIVRNTLLSKVISLRSQQIRTIDLDGRLVGLFITYALESLQNKIGRENVILDLWNRNLRIRGNDDIFETAQELVRFTRQRHLRGQPKSVVACPVCFDQVTAPITLTCGHSWCRSCLSSYLISSIHNKYFPLTCLGNDAKCTEHIPLSIAQEILPVHDLDAIVHAAFSSHVQTRPDEFHYCPSPDCPQIYRTTAGGTVLQCPSCLLRICPNCHVEAHDGFVCPDVDGGDNRFREWMRDHDVKNCPGCKVPIERSEGCNHMTCTRCQTHICWECLETFPKGQGIYDHMRSVHGGISLAPVEF